VHFYRAWIDPRTNVICTHCSTPSILISLQASYENVGSGSGCGSGFGGSVAAAADASQTVE
jgi:hypothetical protein